MRTRQISSTCGQSNFHQRWGRFTKALSTFSYSGILAPLDSVHESLGVLRLLSDFASSLGRFVGRSSCLEVTREEVLRSC